MARRRVGARFGGRLFAAAFAALAPLAASAPAGIPACAQENLLVVFGEYPVVEELGAGSFGVGDAEGPLENLIEYGEGADYREKAKLEALHFLDAGVYGYTFVYKPGSALMKTEETFSIELRGRVPESAVREVGAGVVQGVYRVRLGFELTPSVRSWRAAFRTNTIRLTDAEGAADFYEGWDGRGAAYRDALKNLVLVSARNRLSSKPLVLKGDILLEGNPTFGVGAGRHYCRLQGYVNFVEIVTYD